MVDNIGGRSNVEGLKFKIEGTSSSTAPSDDGFNMEQDRLLPIANVGRIIKKILPTNAKVSKEAKETMQECLSEFISFVTGEASEKCHKEKRKTLNGDDICWALGTLGFEDYVEPLTRYLHKYRELEGEKANQNKVYNAENIDEPCVFRSDDQPKNQPSGPTPIQFHLIESNCSNSSRPF